MKKYGILALVTAVVLVAAVVGWKLLGGNGRDVTSSLPKDVTMVGRIDLKSLWSLLPEGEDVKTGIDARCPLSIFASQGYLGVIVPLSDADDFEEFLLQHSHPTEHQRGIRWSGINGKWMIGYTDDRAMMMGPGFGSELDNLRNTIAHCLQQDEAESGMQSPLYAKLAERKEPIALSSDLQLLGSLPVVGEKMGKLADLPLSLTAGLTIDESGTGTMQLTLSTEDVKLNKLLDQIDEAFQPVNANLLQTAPANDCFLHAEMGLKGERLIELLRMNPDIRTKLLLANTIFDADLILKSIEGDVSLTIPMILWKKPEPLVQAEMKEVSFLNNVSSWNDEISRQAGVVFTPSSQTTGRITLPDGSSLYYGVDGKRLSISPKQNLVQASAHFDLAYNWTEEMKAHKLYVRVTPANFVLLSGYFHRSHQVTLTASSAREWQMEFTTMNLRKLFKLIYRKL